MNYSLDTMCRTQEANYEKTAAPAITSPRPERDGIVICGAYGKGNAG